jgi:hypothetical protein
MLKDNVSVNNHHTKDTLKNMKFLSSVPLVEIRHSVMNVGFDSCWRDKRSNFQRPFFNLAAQNLVLAAFNLTATFQRLL